MPTLTPAQKAKLDQQWTSAGYSPDQMAKLYAWYESGNKATRAQVGAPAPAVPIAWAAQAPAAQSGAPVGVPPPATAVSPAIPATSTPSMPASGATQAAPAVPPTSSTAPGAAPSQKEWEKIATGAKSRGYSDQDILALKSAYATGGKDAAKAKLGEMKGGQAAPAAETPQPPAAGAGTTAPTSGKASETPAGAATTPAVGTETAPGAAWAGKTGETAGQPAQPVKTPKEMAAELLANNPNVGYVDFSNYLNKHPEVNNDPAKRDLVMQTWAETWAQKNVMTKYASATAGQVAEAVTSGKLAMGGPTWAALQLANPTMAANVAAEVEKRRKIDVANRAAQIAAESAGATSTSVADHRTTEGKVSDDATAGYDPFKITLLSDELAKDEKAETTRIALAQNDKDIKETEDAMRNTFEDLRKQYPLAPLSTLSAMAARMNVPLNEKLITQQRDRDYNAGMLTYYVDIAKANVQAKNEIASENRKNAFTEKFYAKQQADQQAQYSLEVANQFKRDELQYGRDMALKKMEITAADARLKGDYAHDFAIAAYKASLESAPGLSEGGTGTTTTGTGASAPTGAQGFQENMNLARPEGSTNVANDTNNPGNITADSIPAGETVSGYGEKIGAIGTYKSPNGRTYYVFKNSQDGKASLANDIQWKQAGNTQVASLKSANATLGDYLRAHTGSDQAGTSYAKAVMAATGANMNTKFRSIDAMKLADGISKAEGYTGTTIGGRTTTQEAPTREYTQRQQSLMAKYNEGSASADEVKELAKAGITQADANAYKSVWAMGLEEVAARIVNWEAVNVPAALQGEVSKLVTKMRDENAQTNAKELGIDLSKMTAPQKAAFTSLNWAELQAAKAIANMEGNVLQNFSVRGDKKNHVDSVAQLINPDIKQGASQYITNVWTKSGTQTSNSNAAISTAALHMAELKDAYAALKNGNVQPMNTIVNDILEKTGKVGLGSFDLNATAVADELAKAYGATAQSDRDALGKLFSGKVSPVQFDDTMGVAARLMLGKLSSNAQMYKANVGMKPKFDSIGLTPLAVEWMREHQGSLKLDEMIDASGAEWSAGDTYTLPSGKSIDLGLFIQ